MKKILFLFALLIAGCSNMPTESSKSASEESVYQSAHKALVEDKSYRTAIEYYEALEARFPFGKYATEGQLEIIEAYLKIDELESAVAAADRFVRLHPQHAQIDKAYYLKALALFQMNWSLVQRILPIDMTERDQKAARDAFNAFAELVKLYPKSTYAEEGRQRMVYLRNGLAEHELHIARYYEERTMHVAAAQRAQYIVEHFPRTPAVKEALQIQIKSYKALQLDDLAEAAEQILVKQETVKQ